jgi:cell division protein FtsW (lipid II flippase)
MLKKVKTIKLDPHITILTFTLLFVGFAIFFSASLGVMARHEAKFYNVLQNQALFGIVFGSIAFFIGAVFPREYLKNLSPVIYLAGIVLCILVYVPGIGFEHGGARRWIAIGNFSMQPSEILKYASVMLLGAIYTWQQNLKPTQSNIFQNNKLHWKNIWISVLHHRFTPIIFLLLGVGIVLKNPDLGTSTIILSGIFAVFFVIRAKWSDLLIVISLLSPILIIFYLLNPHAQERINTFISPEKNTGHQNYQVQQTKISLGAGGLWGDGFAQGVQKYHHLPEPIGDSIFAVIGEEFGFFGVILILLLVIALGYRLIYISLSVRDPFGKAVLVGTGTVILVQTFLNAGSSSAAIPFTGVPFPLVSHGSTSIIITMAMLGLCSQISAKKFIG